MKRLKFAPDLAAMILAGEKTTTWRLFDDKDLTQHDEIEFINSATGEIFGTAVITNVDTKTFANLTDKDWEGHERFASEAEMYSTYSDYYKQPVNDATLVKIIHFKFG